MKNKKVHAGAVAGSVLIAIIITVILSSAVFMLTINRVFTSDFLASAFKSVKIEQIEIPVEINGNSYDSLSEAVVGEIVASNPDSDIKEEDVEQFFEEAGVSEFIGEKLGVTMDALMNGESASIITTDEIMNLIEENEQLVKDTFDIEITEEDKQKLEEQLEESKIDEIMTTDKITEAITGTGTGNGEAGAVDNVSGIGVMSSIGDFSDIMNAIKTLREVFSTVVLVITYVIVALLWLGIFFLNRRQLWYAGPYLGVPAIIVGVCTLIISLVIKIVFNAVAAEFADFIKPEMANVLVELLMIIGIIHLAVGIIVTVVSGVVKHSFTVHDRELAATTETVEVNTTL